MSSLWDAAYEETPCYKNRENESTWLKHVCYLHEKNLCDDFIPHYHLGNPWKPLFRICVQKHSKRTPRFPRLPLDVMALFDSADVKLIG